MRNKTPPLEKMVEELLEEQGAMTTRELVVELEDRGWAYSVVGEDHPDVEAKRSPISSGALERVLERSLFTKTDNNRWRKVI